MIRKPMIDIEVMIKEGLDPRWNAKRPAEVMEQELESFKKGKRNGTQRRSIKK